MVGSVQIRDNNLGTRQDEHIPIIKYSTNDELYDKVISLGKSAKDVVIIWNKKEFSLNGIMCIYKGYSEGIKLECDILLDMNKVIPENSAKVFARIESEGKGTYGFVEEHIYGKFITSVFKPPVDKTEADSVIDQLRYIVRSLKANGIVHGDLHANNVFIRKGKVVVIDPFVYDYSFKETMDESSLKEWERLYNNSLSSLRRE